jgi:hypothetical protein
VDARLLSSADLLKRLASFSSSARENTRATDEGRFMAADQFNKEQVALDEPARATCVLPGSHSSHGGKPHGELRTTAHLAGDRDAPAVGFDDGLDQT